MSFTERVFPWGHAGDFWITIQAFDRNVYGKKADGAFGIKEVRESRTRGAYGCVSHLSLFFSASLSLFLSLLLAFVSYGALPRPDCPTSTRKNILRGKPLSIRA